MVSPMLTYSTRGLLFSSYQRTILLIQENTIVTKRESLLWFIHVLKSLNNNDNNNCQWNRWLETRHDYVESTFTNESYFESREQLQTNFVQRWCFSFIIKKHFRTELRIFGIVWSSSNLQTVNFSPFIMKLLSLLGSGNIQPTKLNC